LGAAADPSANPVNVSNDLTIRARQSAVRDGPFSGVICGRDKTEVAVKSIEKV
jgi:hypothetical protein